MMNHLRTYQSGFEQLFDDMIDRLEVITIDRLKLYILYYNRFNTKKRQKFCFNVSMWVPTDILRYNYV